MAESDLEAGLRTLRESLQQIKSLLAWEKLKKAEARPSHPPAFQVYDPTETELRNEFSFFLARLADVHGLLDDGSAPTSEQDYQNARRQLLKLEQELQASNLHQRFWKS